MSMQIFSPPRKHPLLSSCKAGYTQEQIDAYQKTGATGGAKTTTAAAAPAPAAAAASASGTDKVASK